MIKQIREAILNGVDSVYLHDNEIRKIKERYSKLDTEDISINNHTWLCIKEADTHIGIPNRVFYICVQDRLWRGETLREFVRRTGCYD